MDEYTTKPFACYALRYQPGRGVGLPRGVQQRTNGPHPYIERGRGTGGRIRADVAAGDWLVYLTESARPIPICDRLFERLFLPAKPPGEMTSRELCEILEIHTTNELDQQSYCPTPAIVVHRAAVITALRRFRDIEVVSVTPVAVSRVGERHFCDVRLSTGMAMEENDVRRLLEDRYAQSHGFAAREK